MPFLTTIIFKKDPQLRNKDESDPIFCTVDKFIEGINNYEIKTDNFINNNLIKVRKGKISNKTHKIPQVQECYNQMDNRLIVIK